MVIDFHHATKPKQPEPPTSQAFTEVGLNRSLWWMVFLADTVTLSMVFQHFKTFTVTPSLTNGGWLLLSTAALLAFTGALVYDGYAKEKEKGALKNPFKLFDWVYTQQTSSTPTTSHSYPHSAKDPS